MKLAHAVIALVLCAIFIGLVAGAASAAYKASPTSGLPTPVPGKYTPRYAGEAGYKASPSAQPTVKHMIAAGELKDQSRNIPRSTPSPTPVISVKPSLKARHSLGLLAAFKVSPTASVTPTKISRKNTNAGALAIRVSPSAKPTIKRNIKFLQVAPNGVQTPAQSYGIYGLGGNVPTPTTVPSVRPIPSGSPTPVPGFYTPRYPGEAGANKTLVIPPTPTPRPRAGSPASAVSIPYANGGNTGRGTTGACTCVGLSDDARYAGRGPGLFGSTLIQTPASAPGPNARPVAKVVIRR